MPARCGCAFCSDGRPCVAQRVWPMPGVPPSGCSRSSALEVVELADAAPHLDVAVRERREPGRVVAAVLELPEPSDEDGARLARADVSDDAAHGATASAARARVRARAARRALGVALRARASARRPVGGRCGAGCLWRLRRARGAAPPSPATIRCGTRLTTSAPAGTSRVTVVPAPT